MSSPRTRTPLMRVLHVLLWIMVVCWVLFTGWRLFGPDLAWPIVMALSFTPYVAAGTVIPILLAICLRDLRLLTVLVVCVCALAVVLVPRAFGTENSDADRPFLDVMTANVLTGGADIDTVADIVSDNEIDVLAVQELTEDSVAAIEQTNIDEQLPHQLLKPDDDAAGAGIYSRYELTENEELSPDSLFYNPAATIDVPNFGTVEFVAVHPSPPISFARTENWSHDLRALPAADPAGPPRIMAGDFNATLDHETLRDLLDTGYTDAADATGYGFIGTWPADRTVFPMVTIDHILTGPGGEPGNYAAHDVPGSDHHAITATVTFRRTDT